jgi:hypothetical protein
MIVQRCLTSAIASRSQDLLLIRKINPSVSPGTNIEIQKEEEIIGKRCDYFYDSQIEFATLETRSNA